MRFPGYVVTNQVSGGVTIKRDIFDDTELSTESNWMEGYANSVPESGVWIGRDIEAALEEIRKRLSR